MSNAMIEVEPPGSGGGKPDLLSVRDLVVRYPVRRGLIGALRREPHTFVSAVNGVSLSLGPGEMLAVVGESGCGKTSTAQAVLRMVDATSGTIEVGGRDITHLGGKDLRRVRRSMQIVYQDPYESLDPRFRVRRAVEEPMVIHGIGGSKEEREALVVGALERVELAPADLYIDRYPHELSGGQRQRVNIARAIATEPRFVVLDEPTSSLDVSLRAKAILLLAELRATLGMSYLFISHDLATVKYLAGRVAVMYLGTIVEEASTAELFRQPRHPYTKALLSAVPVPDPTVQRERLVLRGEVPSPIDIPAGCRLRGRCPLAQPVCAEPVTLREVAPRHRVACHLA